MSGSPWEAQYHVSVTATGVNQYFKIPTPYRGYLSKLVVTQASGAYNGFNFDLYNSLLANPSDPITVDAVGQAQLVPSVYQIIPTQTIASADTGIALFGLGYPFENQDVGLLPLGTRGGYLVLRINSATIATFNIGIGVSSFSLL